MAAALTALLLVSGCGAETAGSATVNTAAALPSSSAPTAPAAPSGPGPGPAGSTAPGVRTMTVTAVSTVTTTPPPVTATPASTAPAVPPTDLAGEVRGFITAVDVAGGTLTVDKIDWFTGADAQRACAADGVTDTSNNWCTGYYWRNRNPALRTVAISPDAAITVLDGAASVPGSPADVARRISLASSTYLLVVRDGRVTELHETYAP